MGFFRAIIQGIKSLMLYPLRSMLTMLGIIFGVCSVIAMLAIGEGQKQKAEEEIKKLGAINIIITSQKPIAQEVQGQRTGFVAKYGVKYDDAARIADLRDAGVIRVLPEKIRREDVAFDQFVKKDRAIYGTTPYFLEFSQAEVVMGRFLSEEDEMTKNNVCVISTTLASELFAYQNPLTNEIKVGKYYYRVVGLVRTPADLLRDFKEQKQRVLDEAVLREAAARLEEGLAEQNKIIDQRRKKLKTGTAKERMVGEVIEREHLIENSDISKLNKLPPIVFQERLESQDTPESKWFSDQSGKEFFVTPENWVYAYEGNKAELAGHLGHGRVMRMAMEADMGNQESNLGKANEFYGDVYVPFHTLRQDYGDREFKRQSGGISAKEVQIDRLRVQFDEMNHVIPGAKMLERTMRYGHQDVEDFVIRVPLDELATARKINLIFTVVLATIASISLLVGGIGIMNIMLATVTERTSEIGVRRALGAKKLHIIRQFLVETSVLSVAGGMLGILVGLSAPLLAQWILVEYYQYELAILFTNWSVALAFGISVCIGIIFGIYPAFRAANLDPIEALRHS
ncbi:MAG: ABC transporter permease [Verrucomicrobiota bacterium]|nr:ABC transporter permease [Verrucomicrobiota bacterium]